MAQYGVFLKEIFFYIFELFGRKKYLDASVQHGPAAAKFNSWVIIMYLHESYIYKIKSYIFFYTENKHILHKHATEPMGKSH